MCTKGNYRFPLQIMCFDKTFDCLWCIFCPDGILKWSQSLLCVENTGFNGIQKCVLCHLSFAMVLHFSTPASNPIYSAADSGKCKITFSLLYSPYPQISNAYLICYAMPKRYDINVSNHHQVVVCFPNL